MIQVSKRFKEKVYAPTRKTDTYVTFEILDNTAYEDNSISVPTEAIISRKSQLTNKKRNMTHKYATFELDYFKLDGSFHIPPKQDEGNAELGYWSDDLCDENGIFNPTQIIEVNFTEPHNSLGLTITFDILTNEYATDFDITVYGANNDIIHTENVVNNDKPLYVLEEPLDNYKRIVLSISKWCKPYRRARVVEIDFGLAKEYRDEKLISLNVIEEVSLIGDTVPSNELVFTIDNSDRAFNILNPDGFYRFLRERQEVYAYMGVMVNEETEDLEEFEYVPMGKFYLTEWKSDEGTLTTTFTARDVFEILDNIEYISITDTNLYDLAEDILVKAGMKNYVIDERLKTIHTSGFTEPLSSRAALQCVAIAGECIVNQNRQGTVEIKHVETLSESTGILYFAGPDMHAGMITPEVDEDFEFKTIDLYNVYQEPQIKLDELIKDITIKVFDGTEEGQEVKIVNGNHGKSVKLENPLINTVQHAQRVAEWIIRESNLRAIYDINWRQNPALELGDVVLIEDGFNEKRRSRIIKNEFNFDGALSGKTETKGGV